MLIDNDSEDKKQKEKKKCGIKTKLKFKEYKNCFRATKLENKINQLEKNKVNTQSFFTKKQKQINTKNTTKI